MEDIKKLWYRPGEVTELTGIPVWTLRIIADRNPSKIRTKKGRRKFHYTLVESLLKSGIAKYNRWKRKP